MSKGELQRLLQQKHAQEEARQAEDHRKYKESHESNTVKSINIADHYKGA